MQYFALLISKELERTPDEQADEMAKYQSFHAKASSAIRGGDALALSGGRGADHRRPGRAGRHRRPVRRGAPRWPRATTCSRPKTSTRRWPWPATSRWPGTARWSCGRWSTPANRPAQLTGNDWLALLLEPPASRTHARARRSGRRWSARHGEFAAAAGEHIIGRRRLARPVHGDDGAGARRRGPDHRRALSWRVPRSPPASTSSRAADRDEAVKLASMIPASAVAAAAAGGGIRAVSTRMANLDGVFRREWGPAVAALARWSGDLTVAEDAVQEACAEALRSWPARRRARQPRRVAGDRRPQPRPGPAASRIRPSRKGIGGCAGRLSGRAPITPTRIRSATTSCG